MDILTRKQAIALGLRRYFTGKPCPKGHITERLVDGACWECAKESKRVSARKPKSAEKARLWRKRNPDKMRTVTKAAGEARWRKENKDRVAENNARWRENRRDVVNARSREWAAENRGTLNANTAKRRASKMRRTPKWADTDALREVYKNRPKGMVVDHIIPLQGTLVSGLHVHNNLQYLTRTENAVKGNRFDPWTFEG